MWKALKESTLHIILISFHNQRKNFFLPGCFLPPTNVIYTGQKLGTSVICVQIGAACFEDLLLPMNMSSKRRLGRVSSGKNASYSDVLSGIADTSTIFQFSFIWQDSMFCVSSNEHLFWSSICNMNLLYETPVHYGWLFCHNFMGSEQLSILFVPSGLPAIQPCILMKWSHHSIFLGFLCLSFTLSGVSTVVYWLYSEFVAINNAAFKGCFTNIFIAACFFKNPSIITIRSFSLVSFQLSSAN